jgi:adenine-specific DNA methylase
VNLLRKLINKQTLPGIMSCMPLLDWKQWAKERLSWMRMKRMSFRDLLTLKRGTL